MNWYAYRLPGATEVISGSSERLVTGLCHGGFVIAPFDGNIDSIFTIPSDNRYIGTDISTVPDAYDDENGQYPFPAESTLEEDHANMVRSITNSIKNGELNKCVVSRVIVLNGQINIKKTFRSLCSAYPEAFVFSFHTPKSGTWIGASPEILLVKEGNTLHTMSLAGTRPSGSTEEWDDKNIGEQQIVTKYICDTFRQCGMTPETQSPTTCCAGPVEHIMTGITTTLPPDSISTALEFSLRLSPTPALSGFPKKEALTAIGQLEQHKRGYYGGFCGPVDSNGDFSFFVNLRSARIKNPRYCLFVGGGIVENSDPASEWEETRRKSATMLDYIKLKD